MKAKAFRTIPRILRINARKGYKISCLFSNGESRIIDFETLFRDVFKVKPGDTDYVLMEDERAFAEVKVVEKNLCWPNVGFHGKDESGNPLFLPYELDPIILYQNSQPDMSMDIDIAQMIRNLRLAQGLTQTELAEKSGTTKQYISRLENNHADIELMTLKRIVEGGLGRHLDISIK
jgi:DNA-binding XRE family transcriptional regulator